jgi:pimeloyl-ACP methyl ester carboxylesterase
VTFEFPPPPPPPEPPQKRVPRWSLIVLVLAGVVLVGGAVFAWMGGNARDDAERDLARSRHRITAARGVLHRAETDLAAAQATVATFGTSAQAATAATARVVEIEGRLVDLLTRLRAAGESTNIDTYNRLVDNLNSTSDELVAAFNALDPPLRDFSDAIDVLPSARCSAAIATTARWTDYGGDGLQCARVRVPLDYTQPRGRQIQITVVRRPADDPAQSLGPLVINPGGPGLSAVSFMRDALLLLPPELLRRFDLVAFDPRGVGHSTAVDCADNLDPLYDGDLTAESPAVRDAAVDAVEQVIRGCALRSGSLLRHVDTYSAARDMDRVRAAIGAEKLSYLGFSYGTYLGAVYADLFPQRVRAAVLDGAVDPARESQGASSTDAAGFEAALNEALVNCSREPACPFYSQGDPDGSYDALMDRLSAAPLEVDGKRFGRTQAELAVLSGLYRGSAGWSELMGALRAAADGDAKPLKAFQDEYTGRRPDGSYDNETEAHYAINCVDLGGRLTPAAARAAVRTLDSDPPRFGAVSVMFSLPCAFWPVPVVERPPGVLDAEGAPPMLVVGSAGDPATPIEGAEALTKQLKSATLLRSEGTGHTSFARGNNCIDDAVVAYLVTLAPPAKGTTCS